MKINKPGQNEEPLRALLNEWKVTPSLPPSFREQVWRSIERAEAEPMISVTLWTVWSNWIAGMLPRPVLATAYLTLLLAVGASIGWSQARRETGRVSDVLSERYVRLVDPYQAPR